jgi:hypothetical protein
MNMFYFYYTFNSSLQIHFVGVITYLSSDSGMESKYYFNKIFEAQRNMQALSFR